MPIKAVILDMDDLMINSHPAHMKVFEALVKKYDPAVCFEDSLSKGEELKFFGLKITDILKFLINKYSLNIPEDELNNRFNQIMLPIFEKNIEVMPGLYNLLEKIKKYNLQVALASSAKQEKIDIVLKKLKLDDYFSTIVSGEDEIENGKPAPDIFLITAGKMRIRPEDCLVIEDAANGVEAAKAAKMKCIGVHNIFMKQRLGLEQDLSAADLEVNSLKDVKIEFFMDK